MVLAVYLLRRPLDMAFSVSFYWKIGVEVSTMQSEKVVDLIIERGVYLVSYQREWNA